ncbi:MAG: hypothetical protein AAF485_12190, partial [Chloroflexota bacterium]
IFLCDSRKAAAVLTKKHKFFAVYPLNEDVDIVKHLIECDRLELEARRLLSGNDLEACVGMLYSAARMLLSILNSTTESKDEGGDKQEIDVKGTIRLVKKVLDSAQKYHNRSARLKAQRNYFEGMLIGILFLAIISSPLVIFSYSMSELNPPLLIVSLICGGIGAILSVMSRMGNGDLILDHEAGARVLRRLGAFRPIVGAIFGIVIYTLIASNLLPITFNGATDQKELFYAATGFIAGFSERWAPDMLAIMDSRISASVDE